MMILAWLQAEERAVALQGDLAIVRRSARVMAEARAMAATFTAWALLVAAVRSFRLECL